MVNSLTDSIRDINFFDIFQIFFDKNYYELLFPFLLLYALFYTVLGYVGIFKNKQGQPRKAVIVVISLIIAFYGITFEISTGYTIGTLMMMMFPNISTLTILVLSLYVAGSIFGFDFFSGLFRKDHSAYMYMAVGVIGLGSVIYYVGIVMGFWTINPIGPQSQWNMIIGIGLLIMGIVFLFIEGLRAFGAIFLLVFGVYVYNFGENVMILEYFVDPIVFIILIITVLFSYMSSDEKGKQKTLEYKISQGQSSIDEYLKSNPSAKGDKAYKNRIYDIMTQNLESNQKALNKILKK